MFSASVDSMNIIWYCVLEKTFVIVLLDLFHYVIFKSTLLFCLASYFIACHFIFFLF